ncbi:MAG: hypothetical protein JSW54_02005 [Fidelibacterota bacterium]|nr:MAG: hypothetical protein JSW54_02005 [Candidatus Neomarinimicrobiota bacterium]
MTSSGRQSAVVEGQVDFAGSRAAPHAHSPPASPALHPLTAPHLSDEGRRRVKEAIFTYGTLAGVSQFRDQMVKDK